ncbi:hypothetical protein [Microcoleus sp. herbarium14]|uniref:hypothetical protein n=1 Tax=Microcoleus sp. herbarium14 TaxID=3055439 RepID=UPI002FD4EB9B
MEILIMPIAQLFPLLSHLSRVDKLRVIEFLVSELAKEEGLANLESKDNYFEMLHNSDEGARQLAQFLEEQKKLQNA